MKNVVVEVKGNKAVITVDLAQSQGPTKNGKAIMVGTTEGFVGIPGKDGFWMNLNLGRKKG